MAADLSPAPDGGRVDLPSGLEPYRTDVEQLLGFVEEMSIAPWSTLNPMLVSGSARLIASQARQNFAAALSGSSPQAAPSGGGEPERATDDRLHKAFMAGVAWERQMRPDGAQAPAGDGTGAGLWGGLQQAFQNREITMIEDDGYHKPKVVIVFEDRKEAGAALDALEDALAHPREDRGVVVLADLVALREASAKLYEITSLVSVSGGAKSPEIHLSFANLEDCRAAVDALYVIAPLPKRQERMVARIEAEDRATHRRGDAAPTGGGG